MKVEDKNDNSGIVVGCGSIGQRHIENIATLGVSEIVAVDKDRSARSRSEQVGATDVYTDIETALNKHNLQFGVVSVPNHAHIPVAQKLADAGLDIFIEKPLSHTPENVSKLIETVKASGLITLVGCNFRFQPGIRKLRELLQQGVIGSPLTVQIEAGSYLPDWHPDEDYQEMYSASADQGGGAVLDYIHELNYARWLFDDVECVTAMTSSQSHLDVETEDVGAIIMKMENGVLCEVHVDYVQQSYNRSCKIVGDSGILEWDFDRHTIEEYKPSVELHNSHTLPEWETNDMYVSEMEHFLSCIQSRSTTICDIKQGFKDLQVALAALQSAETGRHICPTP